MALSNLANDLSGSFKLRSPIEINGKQVKDLSYDLMKITGELFSDADAKAHKGRKGDFTFAEMDYTYHLYLGMAAIIAENPWIDWTDLARLKGTDLRSVSVIGRAFFTNAEDEASENETSEEPQEATAVSFTQA